MRPTDEATGFERGRIAVVADDLLLCLGFVVVADVLLFALPPDLVAVRTLVGFPLLFFVPGYALLAALYPGRESNEGLPTGPPFDLPQRAAFSFGLSVGVLPPLALVHDVTGVGFALPAVAGSLTLLTVLALLVATVRRGRLPESERFYPGIRRWPGAVADAVTRGSSREVAVNVALALAVTAAVVAVAYSIAVPVSGESYTTFALLTESDDGDLVAGGYPTELAAGEEAQLVVSVENHEGESVEYTVVVAVQRVRTTGGSAEVVEQRELDRMTETVAAGQRWERQHAVVPEMTGENLRLAYLLYKDGAPADPRPGTAYRETHIWISVGDEGGG